MQTHTPEQLASTVLCENCGKPEGEHYTDSPGRDWCPEQTGRFTKPKSHYTVAEAEQAFRDASRRVVQVRAAEQNALDAESEAYILWQMLKHRPSSHRVNFTKPPEGI